MNLNIKELGWQANIHTKNLEGKIDTDWAHMERFAKMIVLETLDQVNKNMELSWIEGEAKIKQHFGVNN
jgi:hypothetical protein